MRVYFWNLWNLWLYIAIFCHCLTSKQSYWQSESDELCEERKQIAWQGRKHGYSLRIIIHIAKHPSQIIEYCLLIDFYSKYHIEFPNDIFLYQIQLISFFHICKRMLQRINQCQMYKARRIHAKIITKEHAFRTTASIFWTKMQNRFLLKTLLSDIFSLLVGFKYVPITFQMWPFQLYAIIDREFHDLWPSL